MKKILPTAIFVIICIVLYYDVKNDPDFKTNDILTDAIENGDISTVKRIIEKDKNFVILIVYMLYIKQLSIVD